MRVQGWEALLDTYILGLSEAEFGWGSCDCLLFVSDASQMICNKDPMSKTKPKDPKTIRNKYKTKEEAYKLIKEYRRSLPNIMDVHFERIEPSFAQRGDIVLFKGGIVNNTFGLSWNRGQSLVKLEQKGLLQVPTKSAKYAWRVE